MSSRAESLLSPSGYHQSVIAQPTAAPTSVALTVQLLLTDLGGPTRMVGWRVVALAIRDLRSLTPTGVMRSLGDGIHVEDLSENKPGIQ
jgi:hypothetical protein